MPTEDVRHFFERVDAEPSTQFTEALLSQLRAEYLRAAPDTSRDAERRNHEAKGTIMVEALHDEPRPSVRRNWRRVAVAVAAAAALIVATIVLVRTESDDGGNVQTPAGPGLSAPAPGPSTPSARSPLPDGTTLLPPEGATPSAPETGQLLAPLPIPIWVYEDGRVISARWTTGTSWTGFLEQRLTPEGVELVRAEILALEPVSFVGTDGRVVACAGGAGNYWYGDGARDVCESPGDGVDSTNMYTGHPQFKRLSELLYGAPSWLPASAWADPEPKPYVPSTYLIWIHGSGPVVGGISNPTPIDTTAMLAALPTEAAELLTNPGPCPPSGAPTASPGPAWRTVGVCFQVTTEVARHVSTAVGFTGSVPGPPGGYAGYSIVFTPYLPHGDPVECCAG